MKNVLIPGRAYNPGDKVDNNLEIQLDNLSFFVHKFNKKVKPKKNRIVIFPSFGEFGSEIILSHYVIPKLLQEKYIGRYSIVVGWYGREYLYRHLVDEFWEIKEDFQHLREYSRALHHESKNLERFEKILKQEGEFIPANSTKNCISVGLDGVEKVCGNIQTLGDACVLNECFDCCKKFPGYLDICPFCSSKIIKFGIFYDLKNSKKNCVWVPPPSNEKIKIAQSMLPENAVGITARYRKCYGRNLPSIFYKRLIYLLQELGYNPVWLGETHTTLPCPVDNIPDFTKINLSRDLELTLGVVSKLKFTIQFWTASTRLAGMVGTPFILFESPDQVWLRGQEGMRLFLSTKGQSKLVISHYLKVLEYQTQAIELIRRNIIDLENGNYSTVIGLVENRESLLELMNEKNKILSQCGKI